MLRRRGRERYAMSKYAALEGSGADPCKSCAGDCEGSCRYGISIQPNMLKVHNLLTLA